MRVPEQQDHKKRKHQNRQPQKKYRGHRKHTNARQPQLFFFKLDLQQLKPRASGTNQRRQQSAQRGKQATLRGAAMRCVVRYIGLRRIFHQATGDG